MGSARLISLPRTADSPWRSSTTRPGGLRGQDPGRACATAGRLPVRGVGRRGLFDAYCGCVLHAVPIDAIKRGGRWAHHPGQPEGRSHSRFIEVGPVGRRFCGGDRCARARLVRAIEVWVPIGVRLLVDGPPTIGTRTIVEASVFSGPPVRLHLDTFIGTVMAFRTSKVGGPVRSPRSRPIPTGSVGARQQHPGSVPPSRSRRTPAVLVDRFSRGPLSASPWFLSFLVSRVLALILVKSIPSHLAIRRDSNHLVSGCAQRLSEWPLLDEAMAPRFARGRPKACACLPATLWTCGRSAAQPCPAAPGFSGAQVLGAADSRILGFAGSRVHSYRVGSVPPRGPSL